jgi:hypothetical protein
LLCKEQSVVVAIARAKTEEAVGNRGVAAIRQLEGRKQYEVDSALIRLTGRGGNRPQFFDVFFRDHLGCRSRRRMADKALAALDSDALLIFQRNERPIDNLF